MGRFGLDNSADETVFGEDLAGDSEAVLDSFGVVIGVYQDKIKTLFEVFGKG
jgi:hypothetical protein